MLKEKLPRLGAPRLIALALGVLALAGGGGALAVVASAPSTEVVTTPDRTLTIPGEVYTFTIPTVTETTTTTVTQTVTSPGTTTAPPPPPPPASGLFAADSWRNQAVPAGVAVQSGSSAFITKLNATAGGINFNAGAGWTPTLYEATASTPLRSLVSSDTTSGWKAENVPVPPDFKLDTQSDKQGMVVDRARNRVHEFAGPADPVNGTFYSYCPLRLDGPGTWDSRTGMWCAHGGSGIGMLAGIVTPQEITAGVIQHALAAAFPRQLIRSISLGVVYPASVSDGTSDATGVPMGSRFQLDPNLNLDTAGLTGPQKIIARALQVWGLVVSDSTGNLIALYGVNSQSPGVVWPAGTYALPKSLIPSLRWVAPSTPAGFDSPATVGGQPHK